MSEPEKYYAAYCQLETTSGDSQIVVDGNTVIIAAELDMLEQTHVTNRGKEVERIVLSRGDQAMGFLPDNVYKQVRRLKEKGWICRAFASAAVFDKRDESYWAEAAVICYRPKDAEIFEPFVNALAHSIAKGDHPDITLSPKELDQVFESKGMWTNYKPQKLPKLEKGTAYYKTKRTMTENMAYAAAEGNKGCYIGLFLVTFCVIFSIVWFVFLR